MCRNLHLIKLSSSMSKTDKSRRSLLGTQSCQKQLFHGLVVFFSFKSRLRALCGVLAGLGSNLAAVQVAGVGGIYPLKGSSIPSRHPSRAAVFPVPDEPHTSRKNLDLPWNTFLVSFDSTLTRSACLGFLAWCGRAGELTASSSTSSLFAGLPSFALLWCDPSWVPWPVCQPTAWSPIPWSLSGRIPHCYCCHCQHAWDCPRWLGVPGHPLVGCWQQTVI